MPSTLARLILACALLATFIATPSTSQAQWLPGGIPVPGGFGRTQAACSDGLGGVFIGWNDERNYSTTQSDVYATRMTAIGALATGFTLAALPICTNPEFQGYEGITLDSQGGAYVDWLDYRDAYPERGPRRYASRITPSGQIAPGWPTDGLAVSTPLIANVADNAPVPDNEGGAYFFWNDYRTGNSDVYAQRLTASGAPAEGWPIYGVPVATGSGFEDQSIGDGTVSSDGQGGAIVVYRDKRADAPGVYAQRIMPSGAIAPGWPVGGLLISVSAYGSAVSDGAGGAYVSLGIPQPQAPGFFSALKIIRVTGNGQIAPGWSLGGNVICDTVDFRASAHLASDAQGNVFAQWYDLRYSSPALMFAVRMKPDGTFAPGWPMNGRRVSSLNMNQTPGDLIPDGQGGMYSAFQAQNYYVDLAAIQHLGPDGSAAPGWTSDGAFLNQQDGQYDPRLAHDGSGGAYVVWENRAAHVLYIQHYLMDGVVATEISLVSTDVRPDRVSLLWQSAAAQGLSATVYRHTETSAWQTLGTPTLDGPDRLRYEDRSVVAGTRYAYRLGYFDGGTEQFTSETWVDVPALKLALEGARPNPAVRFMNVAFSLPNDSPAKLTVLDVAGRAVMSRDVGSLGGGHHLVPLDLGAAAAPGLYWLRLVQGGHALLARAAVIR